MAQKPLISPPITDDKRLDRWMRQVSDRLNALVRADRLEKTDIDTWALNVGSVTNIATGTGLTGGPITSTGTISLADTAVTPGAYTNTNLTVDQQGRITSAASGTGGVGFGDAPSVLFPPAFTTANATGTGTLTSGSTFFFYMGQAKAAWTTVTAQYRVTRAIAVITWAEIAVYTGAVVLAGNPTLTRRGYADTSAVWNTTGVKTTAITTSGIVPGSDVWLAIGNAATTTLQYRAGSITDELSLGTIASATARPSTTGSVTPTGAVGGAFFWGAIQGS